MVGFGRDGNARVQAFCYCCRNVVRIVQAVRSFYTRPRESWR